MESNSFLETLPYKVFCFGRYVHCLRLRKQKLLVQPYQLWKESERQPHSSEEHLLCTTINTSTEEGGFQKATALQSQHHLCLTILMNYRFGNTGHGPGVRVQA